MNLISCIIFLTDCQIVSGEGESDQPVWVIMARKEYCGKIKYLGANSNSQLFKLATVVLQEENNRCLLKTCLKCNPRQVYRSTEVWQKLTYNDSIWYYYKFTLLFRGMCKNWLPVPGITQDDMGNGWMLTGQNVTNVPLDNCSPMKCCIQTFVHLQWYSLC